MSDPTKNLHVYLREIEYGDRSSLSILAQQVARNSRVLDLGTGSGALGRLLQQQLNCAVDGVTFNAAEAAQAHEFYRKIEIADLDTCNLPDLFEGENYDYIICADVLEHLKQPAKILAACKRMLSARGRLLISIPNASYCGLIGELLQGEFRYREEGLLDRTHLRFFTRQSLLRFLASEGWEVQHFEAISRELPDSEFDGKFDDLPPAVARFLLGKPDALSYQYVAVAHPHATPGERQFNSEPSAKPQALFTAQLYIGTANGYEEERKIVRRGVIGDSRQTLIFELPGSDIKSLRLDPADRPGFLHLFRISLAIDNQTLWQWCANTDSVGILQSAVHHQIIFEAGDSFGSGAHCLLLGDDPWLELPIESKSYGPTEQLTLELEVGWPMSADYRIAVRQVVALQNELDHIRQQLVQKNELHSQAIALKLETANDEKDGLARHLVALQNRFDAFQQQSAKPIFQTPPPSFFSRWWRALFSRRGGNRPISATEQTLAHRSTYAVDVIIPVYRGLEDTQRCLNSVLACHCQSLMRIVVINDASPDPAISDWLREISKNDARILLLENERNLGFVATVNRGMSLSETNDVVLLNSDTEVANDWLDRLGNGAYRKEKFGTVTPFSNNATICSYPSFCKENAPPAGISTGELDQLFASCNLGHSIEIPTAVGFCMYIRRDCLRETGLFDVANFGKGYGEENDFCRRASALGWRHLHALDTYVMHSGGISFGSSKDERVNHAMQTLARLHPNYEKIVGEYVTLDPAASFRLRVDISRIQKDNRSRVLFVLHDRGGGTLRHVMELAAELADQAHCFTLTPKPGNSVCLNLIGTGESFSLSYFLPVEYDDLLLTLRSLGLQLIHYHHLLGHSNLLLRLPRELGLPYDFTIHDYFVMCPQISLTDQIHRYCEERGVEQCRQCLQQRPAPGGLSIDAWRGKYSDFVLGARNILAPSLDARNRVANWVKSEKVLCIPHTDLSDRVKVAASRTRTLQIDSPLRIVVLGALSEIKGVDTLEQATLIAAQQNAPLEFHLIGYPSRPLQSPPRAQLTVHGPYQDAQLPELLTKLQPDLVWFPALWPETYSYTLSVCLVQGIPVVAPDLGAFPERLKGRAWSWIQPWYHSAQQWTDFFLRIRQQHFLTGEGPTYEGALMSDAETWTYRKNYLTDLRSDRSTQPLTLNFIDAHRLVRGASTSIHPTGL